MTPDPALPAAFPTPSPPPTPPPTLAPIDNRCSGPLFLKLPEYKNELKEKSDSGFRESGTALVTVLQGWLGNNHIQRSGLWANPEGEGGPVGDSGGIPTGEWMGDPSVGGCHLRGSCLPRASCVRFHCRGCLCLSYPSGWKQGACMALLPFAWGQGAWGLTDPDPGEGEAWGRAQPRNPTGHTGLAKMAELSWLRAQCFKGWARNGPFRFSTGDLGAAWRSICPQPRWGLWLPLRRSWDVPKSLGTETGQHVIYFPGSNVFFLSFMREFPVNPSPVIHAGCVLPYRTAPYSQAPWLRTQPAGPLLTTVACSRYHWRQGYANGGEHFPFLFFKHTRLFE